MPKVYRKMKASEDTSNLEYVTRRKKKQSIQEENVRLITERFLPNDWFIGSDNKFLDGKIMALVADPRVAI